MKPLLTVFFLLLSWITCYGQDCQWDVYSPERYAPEKYVPITSNKSRTITPYRAKNVTGTLTELKQFIHLSNQNSSIKESFLLDYSRYIDIAAKASVKGTSPSWKNKELNAFVKDYRLLEYYVYRRDSINSVNERTKFVKDSLKKRALFYSDSLEKRMTFYQDSLKYREQFVTDSLYRAEYRKKNRYDKVEWSAPHGDPILCYRNGKIIDGKLFDDKGRLLKEWKNGRLEHDMSYSYDSDYYWETVYDKVEKSESKYKWGVFNWKIWYDSAGREVKKLNGRGFCVDPEGSYEVTSYYKDGSKKAFTIYDVNGNVVKKEEYYYFQDGKSKTVTVTYSDKSYPGFIKRSKAEKVISEYFSDGTCSGKSIYYSYDDGKSFVLSSILKYDGTGWVDEYNYDRNGKFEYGVRRLDSSRW